MTKHGFFSWLLLLVTFAKPAYGEGFSSSNDRDVQFFYPIFDGSKLAYCIYSTRLASSAARETPSGLFGVLPSLIEPSENYFSEEEKRTRPLPKSFIFDAIVERERYQKDFVEQIPGDSLDAVEARQKDIEQARKKGPTFRVGSAFAQIPVDIAGTVLSLHIIGSFLSGTYLENNGLLKSMALSSLARFSYVITRARNMSKVEDDMLADASKFLTTRSLTVDTTQRNKILLDKNPDNDAMIPLALVSGEENSLLCDLRDYLKSQWEKEVIGEETYRILLEMFNSMPLDGKKMQDLVFLNRTFLQVLVDSYHQHRGRSSSFYKKETVSRFCPKLTYEDFGSKTTNLTYEEIQTALQNAIAAD